jgi:hypothetical protein
MSVEDQRTLGLLLLLRHDVSLLFEETGVADVGLLSFGCKGFEFQLLLLKLFL